MHRSKHPVCRPLDSKGSALLIALMVMVVVTLLGITYLFQADTENLIARNERDRAQVLGIAEAGARMVKTWYDRPIFNDISSPSRLFLNAHDLRKKKYYDVAQRLINVDGDPGTAALSSSDPGWVYYMEGLTAPGSPASDTDPNHALRFFQKPYRGSTLVTLLGTEDGPDISISEDSASSDVRDFLAAINTALFTEHRITGRITKIEIYEPPYINLGGQWERFGVGTVKVTAAKFRPATGGGEEKLAERVVKMVLNEAPYPGPQGPLDSCQGIQASGSFEVHWGAVTAVADVEINTSSLDGKWDSGIPWVDQSNYVDLDLYMADVGAGAGTVIEDPWLTLRTLGFITDAPNGNPLAWPTDWESPDVAPLYDEDKDHSNIMQNDTSVRCPDMPYNLWKSVAKDGGRKIHYLTWVAADQFKEGNVTKTFQEWTHGSEGLFFFDTVNSKEADGTNLTPPILINGAWYTEGFIFLNAQNIRTTGVSGSDIAMLSPGEPFDDIFTGGVNFSGVYNAETFTDLNANDIWDPGEAFNDDIPPANGGTDGTYDAEPWVNIDYATTMGGGGSPPEHRVLQNPGTETATFTLGGVTTTRTTTNARDRDGLPVQHEVNLYGLLYNSGAFSLQGNGVYFGAVIAAGGVGEDFFGPAAAGDPEIYFDERLIKGEWPPPEIELPLVIITLWKTDF